MIPFTLHLCAMTPFSADGVIYRAFDHLIAARCGAVLLVPIYVAQGRLTGVVDGCPVPWEEVCAVLDDDLADAQAVFFNRKTAEGLRFSSRSAIRGVEL